MNYETREHNTREALLLINNDEYLYNLFRQYSTITEISHAFNSLICRKIRKGIGTECYSLHDVNFGDFLEGIEFDNTRE